MANLDIQQSPTVNSSIDVPNLVTSLNDSTGPQARPQAFGPDLSGLAEGLDRANQSIYQATREQDRIQQSKDELWATRQHVALDQSAIAKQAQMRASGQIDPDAFNTDFQNQVADISAQAPTEYAKAAFERGAAVMGDGYLKSNMALVVAQQKMERTGQVRDIGASIQQKVAAGILPADAGSPSSCSSTQPPPRPFPESARSPIPSAQASPKRELRISRRSRDRRPRHWR